MAPEDHYRRLVSALSEASTFEDPQRLYHLGLPSHGMCPHPLAPSLTKCLPMCVGLLLSLEASAHPGESPWGLRLLTPRLGLMRICRPLRPHEPLVGGHRGVTLPLPLPRQPLVWVDLGDPPPACPYSPPPPSPTDSAAGPPLTWDMRALSFHR